MGQNFSDNPPLNQSNWLHSFWKFSRPHTIIGTSLSVLGLYLITIASIKESSNLLLPNLFGTWIACLCGNVYIVGLNQLEDIEIDQINKPNLPLASGDFSKVQAQTIVAITGILSLLLAAFMGKFLFSMVAISLIIGTAYSLPPIRLKRFPFWAAFCIFTVRGTVVNLGLFLHFNWLGQKSQEILPEVWALTLFILVFTLAIALCKDIPDMQGDRHYNISTLTIKWGAKTVFNVIRWILTVCYLGMILGSMIWLNTINPLVLVSSHLLGLGLMWWKSWGIDCEDKQAITNFYQVIWKLFFLEYLIFPVACLFANG